jgi:hypothetical protein
VASHSEEIRRIPVHAQIDELGLLQPNWDGYGAPRIDPAILDSAHDLAASLPDELPAPMVVPMSAGNLQLEWDCGQRSLELEIESPLRIHYLKWSPAEGVEVEDTCSTSDLELIVALVSWCMEHAADER